MSKIYNITAKRRRVLAAMYSWAFVHTYHPTIRDIAKYCHISRSTTYEHLQRLLRDGFVKKSTILPQPKYVLTTKGRNCLRAT